MTMTDKLSAVNSKGEVISFGRTVDEIKTRIDELNDELESCKLPHCIFCNELESIIRELLWVLDDDASSPRPSSPPVFQEPVAIPLYGFPVHRKGVD